MDEKIMYPTRVKWPDWCITEEALYWWTKLSKNILYIKTEFAKVCSSLGIFQVVNTPQILAVLVH